MDCNSRDDCQMCSSAVPGRISRPLLRTPEGARSEQKGRRPAAQNQHTWAACIATATLDWAWTGSCCHWGSSVLSGPSIKFADCRPRATLGDARAPEVVLLLPLETARSATGMTSLRCDPKPAARSRVRRLEIISAASQQRTATLFAGCPCRPQGRLRVDPWRSGIHLDPHRTPTVSRVS